MSAYVVDRHHIWYLVKAAEALAKRPYGCGTFTWVWNGQMRKLRAGHDMLRAAQMLWDENIHAVAIRYDDGPLPGPVDEDYTIKPKDMDRFKWRRFSPVQVLKACDCYEYQCVEDPEWEKTEAASFIQALRAEAISILPGYEEAVWGAPEPDVGAATAEKARRS